MIDVSVIIPVYNCESSIGRAIDSVLKQKDIRVEIVCVDDGSLDHTCRVIGNYCSKNECVRLIHQENGGPGKARNEGIQNARGNYIAFLDADDYYIDETALSKMVSKCKSYHVFICGAVMNLCENGIVRRSGSYSMVSRMSQMGILKYKDYQFDYDFISFIYQRDLLIENNVRFPEFYYYEDPPFMVKAFYHADQFVMVDVDYYCYSMTGVVKTIAGERCPDIVDGLRMNMLFALENNMQVLYQNTVDRLLFEYGDWIYRNIDFVEGLREKIEVILPILEQSEMNIYSQRLLIRKYKQDYQTYLNSVIYNYDFFYIFGMGKVSDIFIQYIRQVDEIESMFAGYVVSHVKESDIDNRVMDLSTYAMLRDKGLLVIAVSGIYIGEVIRSLKKYCIDNFVILDIPFLCDIQNSSRRP